MRSLTSRGGIKAVVSEAISLRLDALLFVYLLVLLEVAHDLELPY